MRQKKMDRMSLMASVLCAMLRTTSKLDNLPGEYARMAVTGNRARVHTSMPLSNVPDVDIDPSGVFKYILIRCTDNSSKNEKYIVRGYGRHTFHNGIMRETRDAIGSECKLKCVGGGRIKHEDAAKLILVYGYSHAYGRADHSITVDILKKHYPDYHISYSNEGY
ncbi:unnamed protein product [Cylicocyclus nassatus]|uniref:Sex-regulated protein janus-B n=1 Tax=Cylicocyclus nassatus TaxID=53992 RepID=A0AA36GL24_CYLNA|nr:unnamed protein product [Cylicocyclus nassatus]